jgi:hypothetical protein
MSIKPTDEAVYTDEEIAHLRDELAKRMLNTPPQPLKPKASGGKPKIPPREPRSK